jgi:nicotinate-nucleotide adenylyltransferase
MSIAWNASHADCKEARLLGHALTFLALGVVTLFVQAAQAAEPARPAKVAFFPGTFDPPHSSHRKLIEQALAEHRFDLVYIMPIPNPSHKAGASSFHDRLAMTRLEFSGMRGVQVGDPDLDQLARTGGPQAQVDAIGQRHLDATVFHIVGSDVVDRMMGLPLWSSPANFVILASSREASRTFPERTTGGNVIVPLHDKTGDVSSTSIRRRVAAGDPTPELSPTVSDYVSEQGLYGRQPLLQRPRGCWAMLETP